MMKNSNHNTLLANNFLKNVLSFCVMGYPNNQLLFK